MTDPQQAGTGGGAALTGWLHGLGPLAARRPRPSVGEAAAGIGGALVAGGVVTVAGERWGSSGSNGLAVLLAGALLAAAVAAMVRAPAAVRVAAVAAAGIAAPAFAFFLSAGGRFPSLRSTALVAGLLLALLYGVGPWRGHTFHLAVLVVAGWVFALSLTDLGAGGIFFLGFGGLGNLATDVGVVSMAVGAAYVALALWLDFQGLRGMATPFFGVGAVALPLGAFVALSDAGDLVGGLVALAIGAALALVGGRSTRRGTTWTGAAVAAAGVLAVVEGLSPDEAVVVALLLVAAGAGLVAVAPAAADLVDERWPGDAQAPGGRPPGPPSPAGEPPSSSAPPAPTADTPRFRI